MTQPEQEQLAKRYTDACRYYGKSPTPYAAGLLYCAARDYKLNCPCHNVENYDKLMRELEDTMNNTFAERKQFIEETQRGCVHTPMTVNISADNLVSLCNYIEGIIAGHPERVIADRYQHSNHRIVIETLRDLAAEARANQ